MVLSLSQSQPRISASHIFVVMLLYSRMSKSRLKIIRQYSAEHVYIIVIYTNSVNKWRSNAPLGTASKGLKKVDLIPHVFGEKVHYWRGRKEVGLGAESSRNFLKATPSALAINVIDGCCGDTVVRRKR